MSVYIIAEAGVNHNGSITIAKKMIDSAKAAGVDCIKFQTFKTENLVSKHAAKAEYQKRETGGNSQQEMLQKLELSFYDFEELKQYCDEVGIAFLSTPFDFESIDFLNTIDMPFWKVPSGEVTNYPYLLRLAKTHKPVVMSTGMCEMPEIEAAINVLKNNGAPEVRLLHCNTEYPTPFCDVNLKAMDTMKERFCCEVGYSDHTAGIEVPIAAVAMGASIIEKHFTLDKKMEGPDHKASIDVQELGNMAKAIRNVEAAIGVGGKTVTSSERKNISVARKSIVAKNHISKGELLTEKNLTVKRPGDGISPMKWCDVIGTIAIRDFEKDDLIQV